MSKDSGSSLGSILDVKSSNREHGVTRSKFGLVAVGITGTIVAGLFVGTLPFLTPALRQICLPYVPATATQVVNILRMCKGRPGTLVDLGSGDGRVVLAAAQAGFQAVGYELNLWLVLYSKLKARLQRLHYKTTFVRKDIWKTNLKDFDNIVIFGVEEMIGNPKQLFVQALTLCGGTKSAVQMINKIVKKVSRKYIGLIIQYGIVGGALGSRILRVSRKTYRQGRFPRRNVK